MEIHEFPVSYSDPVSNSSISQIVQLSNNTKFQ